ncbi:hypothetical protein JCGZ_12354 [Jatropha curcas]|uniref:Uncharacterized protein n=1 Tax=Jatropha curcas TaxID=180498 RepID=A0A067KA76_JATCU|nr:hypothetical protein JCGZ_12354 [Jatropha curcas]
MDSSDEDRRTRRKKRELEQNHQKTLQPKMAELVEIKGRLKSNLASISELESELEATNTIIRSKIDREIRAKKIINEISEVLHEERKQLELIKQEKEKERRERSKMKQVLRMRRHTLKTLQATLQAVKIESEAFNVSAAEALGYINNSTIHNRNVELTAEEYFALTEKAKEETTLAEWRVSLFLKQKLAAEVNRNLVLSRLKELKRKKSKEKEETEDGDIIKEVEEEQIPVRVEARAKVTDNSNQKLGTKKRRSRNGKKVGKKKTPSILIQVRRFLMRSIMRLFR